MKSLETYIRIFSIAALLTICQESYCQLGKKDSLAISLMKAVNITDSVNSPLPDSIRVTITREFNKSGLKSNDYYTTKDFYVQKTNNLNEIKIYEIHFRRDFKSLDNLDVSEDSWIIAHFKNITKIENSWIIEFYRIGALRDRCFNKSANQGFERIGAYGEEGDDMIVIFNSNFSKILEITNAE